MIKREINVLGNTHIYKVQRENYVDIFGEKQTEYFARSVVRLSTVTGLLQLLSLLGTLLRFFSFILFLH